MKLKIGSKEVEFTIRDLIYWIGLVGMGMTWYLTDRISDIENQHKVEVRFIYIENDNEDQDEKIDELAEALGTFIDVYVAE